MNCNSAHETWHSTTGKGLLNPVATLTLGASAVGRDWRITLCDPSWQHQLQHSEISSFQRPPLQAPMLFRYFPADDPTERNGMVSGSSPPVHPSACRFPTQVQSVAVETAAVEPSSVETPAVETPAAETPAAETPAVETKDVAAPAGLSPAAFEANEPETEARLPSVSDMVKNMEAAIEESDTTAVVVAPAPAGTLDIGLGTPGACVLLINSVRCFCGSVVPRRSSWWSRVPKRQTPSWLVCVHRDQTGGLYVSPCLVSDASDFWPAFWNIK